MTPDRAARVILYARAAALHAAARVILYARAAALHAPAGGPGNG